MCVCVLGKQGFVGCDCLIPGGLSFHSFSHVIPQHGAVVGLSAYLGSGTCLSRQSPYTPWIPATKSSSRDGDVVLLQKEAVLVSSVSLQLNGALSAVMLHYGSTKPP